MTRIHATGTLSLILALWLSFPALGQPDPEAPLAVDPAITTGRLPNGLRYYIRENAKPENRASFRLVIDAGSLMESESQRGLAHFLEHMAFNGTTNFEKLELVNFLERVGMRFGSHLNAYTSFEETVYMLEIPMDDEEILDTAFRILRDWTSGIRFDPEEIDRERGVVIEEWRSRRGAQGRIMDKQLPVIFHGSRYAERLPIGDLDIIRTAPREEFLDFYRKWYRPDLMAVIAVGEFEKERIERRITETFSDLENPPDGPERREWPVPDHSETLFSIETDPELQGSVVQIAYKRPPAPQGTAGAYRDSIVERLYTGMLNRRLDERLQEADPPYLYAAMVKAPLVRVKDMVLQVAQVKDGAFAEGLRALLLEARRVREHGFTPSELARLKADFLRSMEAAHAEKDKTESGIYAAEYTRNFLQNEPIPGIDRELELHRAFLPGISLEEVDRVASGWITPGNRIILYSAPEREGSDPPDRETILTLMREVDAMDVAPYDDGEVDAPLVSRTPVAGTIVSRKEHPGIGTSEWRLSNGSRILLKPTDFRNDQVLLSASSPGGHSLVSDADFPTASMAANLVAAGGLGDFDRIQLQKKLTGRIAGASPSIGERSEGIGGSASPRDLEVLLQLVHLHFTSPRADEAAFRSLMTQMRVMVANRLNNPQVVFADAISKTLYRDHPRHQPVDPAFLDRLDLDRAMEIYRSRFSDASDFTFIIVGNFDPGALEPLAETWLASLPGKGRQEQARDIGDRRAPGRQEVEVVRGLEPRSSVRLTLHGEAPWSTEERFLLLSAIDVLRIRLREELREEKSGVYGVSVQGGLDRWPVGQFATTISFGCDPEMVETLIESAMEMIAELRREGPSQDTFDKVRKTLLRDHERGMRENGYWLSNLSYAVENDLPPERILDFPGRVEALTRERIRQAALRYLGGENLLVATLLPEEKE